MKTLRTSIIKTPVNYNPELLKGNGIYLAATDNNKIYVDDLFLKMPIYVKTYLLLHEEGHIMNKHPHKRNLNHELEADSYASKKMSMILVRKAMLHIMNEFIKIDWTVAAEYMVRLSDLGCSRAKKMFIIAPNGLKFNVNNIRKYL